LHSHFDDLTLEAPDPDWRIGRLKTSEDFLIY